MVTQLEVDDAIKLLEFTLTTTYFRFKGQLYKQKFRAAMDSLMSPLVADMFMEYLEQMAIATAPLDCKPRLCKPRYSPFNSHMSQNSLPFLDSGENLILTSSYWSTERKHTLSLHFKSHHSPQHKLSGIRTLLDIYESITGNEEQDKEKEIQHIKSSLVTHHGV